jgi:Na+-driven multidrug efflux pump
MENSKDNEIKVVNVSIESEFGTKSIISLFWKYTLFALAGLLFQAVGAVADGFFVGNGIGPIGLATISIVVPFITITIATFLLFGVGSSTLAAIKLGNGDMEGAREVYGNVIVFTFLFSVAVQLIVLLNINAILTLFGATTDVLPGARTYAISFMMGFPLYIVGNTAYSFLRVAERPLIASLVLIAGGILAIIVEYYIIFVLKCGILGSSVAAICSLGITILFIPYLQFSNTVFKLRMSDFKINFGIIKEIVKTGFAIFLVQISSIFSTIIINNLILKHGIPELHIAAFGIMNAYIAYILIVLTSAFVTGIQPIASYNIGARLYTRVASLVKIGITQSTIVIIVIMILVFIFADRIITFFAGPVPELVAATKEAMKIYLILYALGNVTQIVSGYYMAVEKAGLAILNGLARVIIFAIPLLLILPDIFGLKGIWMSQPGADALSFILALICIFGENKRLMKLEAERKES